MKRLCALIIGLSLLGAGAIAQELELVSQLNLAGAAQLRVRDSLVYVARSIPGGLVIVNAADREHLAVLSTYAASDDAWDVEVRENRAYLSMDGALQVIDVADPAQPQWLGSAPIGGDIQAQLAQNDQYLTVLDNNHQFSVMEPLDAPPLEPQGTYAIPGYA